MHQFATNQAVRWRSLPQMLRRTNVQFIQGRVTSLDPAQHEIVIMHQQQTQHLGYDYLVYALGSETDRKTVPGVADYAYTLAAGFNNYPDDKPIPPYFTGWLGYQIREAFVRYLAAPPRFERGWPGLFVWPGKRRYEAAQRRQQAQAKNDSMQLHHV